MQHLANHNSLTLILVLAFLLCPAISLAGAQAEPAVACCEKEAPQQNATFPACSGSDCACISCISIAQSPSLQIDKVSLAGSAVFRRAQSMHIAGFFRSLERPPESC